MRIKVWDDKYVITSDAYCYTLKQIRQKQPKGDDSDLGEVEEGSDGTYEITIAYCNSVANCFKNIVDLEGRTNKCTTMDGYIKHLTKINEQLEENIEKFSAIVGGHERVIDVMTRLAKYADE